MTHSQNFVRTTLPTDVKNLTMLIGKKFTKIKLILKIIYERDDSENVM